MRDHPPLMPMTHLEKIEAGIVEALKQGGLSSRYLIAPFPDNPDAFDMSDAERVALVQYTGSRYAEPRETGSSAQMRRAEFAIHLYLRRLAQPVRALREIEEIRLILQGLTIEGAEISVTRDGLIDQDGDLWRYVIEVALRVPAVPLTRERPAPFITDFNRGA